jgi:hypothetical protein
MMPPASNFQFNSGNPSNRKASNMDRGVCSWAQVFKPLLSSRPRDHMSPAELSACCPPLVRHGYVSCRTYKAHMKSHGVSLSVAVDRKTVWTCYSAGVISSKCACLSSLHPPDAEVPLTHLKKDEERGLVISLHDELPPDSGHRGSLKGVVKNAVTRDWKEGSSTFPIRRL